MKKKIGCTLGGCGFTLVEVVVSAAILFMAIEALALSMLTASRMAQKAGQTRKAGNEINRMVLSGTGGTESTLYLEFGEYRLEGEGYLYTKEIGQNEQLHVIWAETATGSNAVPGNGMEGGGG